MAGKKPDRSRSDADSGEQVPFRGAIRVRPGASRTVVGGHIGGGAPDGSPLPPLLVAVTARAVDGAATAAAEAALAAALGLRPRQVRVIRGHTSRDKLVEVSAVGMDVPTRWRALLDRAPRD